MRSCQKKKKNAHQKQMADKSTEEIAIGDWKDDPPGYLMDSIKTWFVITWKEAIANYSP